MGLGERGRGEWRRGANKPRIVGWFFFSLVTLEGGGGIAIRAIPGCPLAGDNPRLFSPQAFFFVFASESKGKL